MTAASVRDMLLRTLAVFMAALVVSAPCSTWAGATAGQLSPGEQCQAAIAQAEHAYGIPPHLLAAVGRVESGRKDMLSDRWTSWPWTIDVNGQGAFFPTEDMAIAAVRLLQAQGIASIDVGCLQINLSYHGSAFENLRQAFDPALNVAYGARFLRALFSQTGDWGAAVGRYHSATPTLASGYRQKVMAAWSGGAIRDSRLNQLLDIAHAWAATLDAAPEGSRPSWQARRVAASTTWSSAARGERTACRVHGLRACQSGIGLLWQASLESP